MNQPRRCTAFIVLLIIVFAMCSEPPDERGKESAAGNQTSKHFLADKPLKLFSKKQSELLRLEEQIEQAETRARNYKYVYAASTSPLPLSLLNSTKSPVTLEEATRDLTGQGSLRAEIQTPLGDIYCMLNEKTAPLNVAHFVALARGRNPWFNRRQGQVKVSSYYRDTLVYKIVPHKLFYGGYPPEAGEMLVTRRLPVQKPLLGDKQPLLPYSLALTEDAAGFVLSGNFAITSAQKMERQAGLHAIGSCGPALIIDRILGQQATLNGLPLDEIKIINIVVTRD